MITRFLRTLRFVLWSAFVLILVAAIANAVLSREVSMRTTQEPPTITQPASAGRIGQAAVGLSGPAGVGIGDIHATGTLSLGDQAHKALGSVGWPNPFDGLEGTVNTITYATLAMVALITIFTLASFRRTR